jgi:hypothetical protein
VAAELRRQAPDIAAMNATILLADAALRDQVVELVCACRDHVQQKRPSDAEIASSVERLLADPATDFLVAVSAQSGAVGYVQLRYHYSLWVNGPLVRVPAHDGHGSEPMADTVPTAWRTVFRWHGGQFGGRIGMLSAMIS